MGQNSRHQKPVHFGRQSIYNQRGGKSKSITAFIRHGHGGDTIDEYGGWSKDDRRDWHRRKLEREQGKQEASSRETN